LSRLGQTSKLDGARCSKKLTALIFVTTRQNSSKLGFVLAAPKIEKSLEFLIENLWNFG